VMIDLRLGERSIAIDVVNHAPLQLEAQRLDARPVDLRQEGVAAHELQQHSVEAAQVLGRGQLLAVLVHVTLERFLERELRLRVRFFFGDYAFGS
jgi:hypothetical protein